MSKYIKRSLFDKIISKLSNSPVVALLGPRQCGKTFLAKKVLGSVKNSIYLDLERPSDLNKLNDAEAFFAYNKNALICLDEIQLYPELFPILRGIIDEKGTNGQLLILGSASRDLIKQSSESLAGRISYLELSPFNLNEWNIDLNSLWIRGGFPRSLLQELDTESLEWRYDFIRTYLERDIPRMGFNIATQNLERLWRMIAHSQGQLINYSKFAQSLGITNPTVKTYLDILKETFLVRTLEPYESNLKKRLIKTPKVYIRDTGLLHALYKIINMNDLMGYPEYGASWESFAIEQILSAINPNYESFFYRDSSGSEIDLILKIGQKKIAIEFKVSSTPKVSKGFWTALEIVNPDSAWIIAPVKESYPFKNGVMISPLKNMIQFLLNDFDN